MKCQLMPLFLSNSFSNFHSHKLITSDLPSLCSFPKFNMEYVSHDLVIILFIVGLLGLDPCSKLISQTNPCTTCSFNNNLQRVDWGLTWSSIGGWWNQVSASLICLTGWFSPTVNTFVQVTSRTSLTCEAFAPCYIFLYIALTRGCTAFAFLG